MDDYVRGHYPSVEGRVSVPAVGIRGFGVIGWYVDSVAAGRWGPNVPVSGNDPSVFQ